MIPAAPTDPGRLYLVATPIGNLDDISPRAAAILTACDLLACENTRKTGRLLHRLGISRPMMAYHDHNEAPQALLLADRVASGQSVALVSEAGTPTISDPGFRVVRECRRRGLPVVPIPGPSALISALSASGLPTDGFLFVGFLPPKRAARQRFFERYRDCPYTLILYESCHRIARCLEDLVATLGAERTICVAREMTKTYETFHTGTALTVSEKTQSNPIKGEYVVLIAKADYRLL